MQDTQLPANKDGEHWEFRSSILRLSKRVFLKAKTPELAKGDVSRYTNRQTTYI